MYQMRVIVQSHNKLAKLRLTVPIAGPFVGELEGDVVGGFYKKEKWK